MSAAWWYSNETKLWSNMVYYASFSQLHYLLHVWKCGNTAFCVGDITSRSIAFLQISMSLEPHKQKCYSGFQYHVNIETDGLFSLTTVNNEWAQSLERVLNAMFWVMFGRYRRTKKSLKVISKKKKTCLRRWVGIRCYHGPGSCMDL